MSERRWRPMSCGRRWSDGRRKRRSYADAPVVSRVEGRWRACAVQQVAVAALSRRCGHGVEVSCRARAAGVAAPCRALAAGMAAWRRGRRRNGWTGTRSLGWARQSSSLRAHGQRTRTPSLHTCSVRHACRSSAPPSSSDGRGGCGACRCRLGCRHRAMPMRNKRKRRTGNRQRQAPPHRTPKQVWPRLYRHPLTSCRHCFQPLLTLSPACVA